MKQAISTISMALLVFATSPAHADFQYTEKANLSGGMLSGMAKFTSKGGAQAMQPAITTRYIKGNRMRTDHSDGRSEIIDLDARTITEISPAQKTYGMITFDQLKAASEAAQQITKQDPRLSNASLTFKPTVRVTAQPGTRTILGQTANEVRARLDTAVQAQSTEMDGQRDATPQSQQGSATISMSFDLWVAPGVTAYQQYHEFIRRLAQLFKQQPEPFLLSADPRCRISCTLATTRLRASFPQQSLRLPSI